MRIPSPTVAQWSPPSSWPRRARHASSVTVGYGSLLRQQRRSDSSPTSSPAADPGGHPLFGEFVMLMGPPGRARGRSVVAMASTGAEHRAFPSPFDVSIPAACEGWEEMYAYHVPFSEDRRGDRRAASACRSAPCRSGFGIRVGVELRARCRCVGLPPRCLRRQRAPSRQGSFAGRRLESFACSLD